MDYEPRIVYTTQRHEYSSVRKELRSECMYQDVFVMLPWRILMVKLLYHGGSDIDQLDHRAEYARP
jgi:hypothetical protein